MTTSQSDNRAEAQRWMQVAHANERAAWASTGDQRRKHEAVAMDAWSKVDRAGKRGVV